MQEKREQKIYGRKSRVQFNFFIEKSNPTNLISLQIL